MTYIKQGALDLEACEVEPIHFMGAIQPPYAIVAWRPEDGSIMMASENLVELVGWNQDDIAAAHIKDLFEAPFKSVDRFFANQSETHPVSLINGREVLARGCTVGDWLALVLDPETTTLSSSFKFDAVLTFNKMIDEQLAKPKVDLETLTAGLAAAFRSISGYDRVMVYEFDADWNGTIIAECATETLDARFLGLTFPSSDIPRPARDLFLRNRVRPLIDSDAVDVPLMSLGDLAPDAIDIGDLPERAVSPIHLTYLRNMGVRATLTVALIVQDRLWGLLTCHHYSGRRKLSAGELGLCRVLCDLMSHALNRVQDRKRLEHTSDLEDLGRKMRLAVQAKGVDEAFGSTLAVFSAQILQALGASGAVVMLDGKDFSLGAPPPDSFNDLRTRIEQTADSSGKPGFSSNHIVAHFPGLTGALLPDCAGVAMVRNSTRSCSIFAWRPAVQRTITWAGDPQKRVPEHGSLSPRASFERWQDQTAERSAPWSRGHEIIFSAMLDILSEVGWMLERRRAERRADSARAEAERAIGELEHASLHDDLTDLPNRRYLDRKLQYASSRAIRNGADRIAALHLDLDRFKAINDTLGHATGDDVLVHVAKTLRNNKRETDFVARVGGDEFVLIAYDNLEEPQLAALAQDLIDVLSQPIRIEDQQVSFGASVGIAISPLHELKPAALLSRADIALYESKRRGRGRYCFVSDEMAEARIERRMLGEDVLRGFEAQEFELYYQLQFAADDRRIVGAEALLRWNHPLRGVLSPDLFIAAAEEVGVITKLDALSVRSALETRAAWSEQGVDVPKISLNVSSRRLKDMDVSQMVTENPGIAGCIAFELLETIDMNTIDNVSRWNLKKFKEAGITIEIDDFGTGHTSILSLLEVRPDRIKLDKDLVLPAPESKTNRVLIQSIVRIAKTLDIGVTAEGVETEAHITLLRDLGCDTLQGYVLARPMSAGAVLRSSTKLAQNKADLHGVVPSDR